MTRSVDRDRWVATCPECRRELSNPGDTRGWCEFHGSVFVDFGHPLVDDGYDNEEDDHDVQA